jgi:hypothetical protein
MSSPVVCSTAVDRLTSGFASRFVTSGFVSTSPETPKLLVYGKKSGECDEGIKIKRYDG